VCWQQSSTVARLWRAATVASASISAGGHTSEPA
jgi:hypothetical protein